MPPYKNIGNNILFPWRRSFHQYNNEIAIEN